MNEDERAVAPAEDAQAAWVTALLAQTPSPAMPEDVWLRLERSLSELSDARRAVGAASHPVSGRRSGLGRRRLSALVGGAAAACAALLVGGLAVQSAVTGSSPPPPAPPPMASALASTSALAVLHTRTSYTSAALPGQVTDLLARTGLTTADEVRRALRRAESMTIPALAPSGFTSAHPSIAACMRTVADMLGLPIPAVLVDRGTLDGREVGIVVFEAPSDGSLTIAVVDPACAPDDPVSSTLRAVLP